MLSLLWLIWGCDKKAQGKSNQNRPFLIGITGTTVSDKLILIILDDSLCVPLSLVQSFLSSVISVDQSKLLYFI